MHNHSYGNEFNLHLNEIHFHMKGWTPKLALRERLKRVIRKWSIGNVNMFLQAQTKPENTCRSYIPKMIVTSTKGISNASQIESLDD